MLMPRRARSRSESGYYHIMLRGNAKENIFRDAQDKLRFLEIMQTKKEGDRFHLHAFCLMNNHVHLMLSEGTEDLSVVMKRINVSYVHCFNQKYKRVGHLFQDRFKSENVEQDRYLLALARYIHQNPLKAGMVKKVPDYKWSSYNGYMHENNYFAKMLDTDIVLNLFSPHKQTARKEFAKFMNEEAKEIFIDIKEKEEVMDEEAAKELFKAMQKEQDESEAEPLDQLIKNFRSKTSLSIRKIAAITGINKDKVNSILRS